MPNETIGDLMPEALEEARRHRQAELNSREASREALEAEHGRVWSTAEVERDFEIRGFMAPFVVVINKATGKNGSLEFQHSPRFYFNWVEDRA